MASAAQFHLTGADIQDTRDSSNEECLWIVTGDLVIHRRDQGLQRHTLAQGQAFAECLAQRHEQRRWHTFPGDITHDEEKMILVQHKGVVKITTDFFSWFEERMECQVFRETSNGPGRRQHAHLDITSRLEFPLHAAARVPFKFQGSPELSLLALTNGVSCREEHTQD